MVNQLQEAARAARLPGPVRVESPLVASRARRRGRTRSTLLTLVVAAVLAAVVALLFGLAYSGSQRELAEGTSVAGVDVGGLTKQQAEVVLDGRFAEQARVPVTFTTGDESFTFAANQLGVHPDWQAAVAAAARASDGFGPIRGFRRLRTRFFGAEVLPPSPSRTRRSSSRSTRSRARWTGRP